MSGKSTPILCGAIPAFEMFMTMWDQIVDRNPNDCVATYTRAGLEWAHKYYACMDCTPAYIITMCKCLCLPALGIGLIVIYSAAPCHVYVMDQHPMGSRLLYISDAEKKIQDIVSLFIYSYPKVILTYPLKDDPIPQGC